MTKGGWIRSTSVLALLALGGCAQTGFYAQSIRGHLKMMSLREPIDTIIADPETPPDLRTRLERVLDARRFAVSRLGLPDNGSYTSYANLDRRYVLWNVVATPAFAVEPKTWCFLFVGCVSYRGYFAESAARQFAADLAADGFDTYVGGVAAYSTLGKFEDPVLNTMLYGDDGAVAALLFHELAHQRLYIRDDTAFNEAFATVVEEEGLRLWVAEQDDPGLLDAYRSRMARAHEFSVLVGNARTRLELLYASGIDEAAMAAGKRAEFERLRDEYESVKASWGGYSGYDAWFAQDLNNAHLAAVATYRRFVPAFRTILAEVGNDIERFYERSATIGALGPDERHERLEALLGRPETAPVVAQ